MWQTRSRLTRGRGDARTPRQIAGIPPVALVFSPRLLFLSALLLLGTGCSTQEKVVYEPVNTKPIVGDEAMALRSDWPRGVSHYQNGDTGAWSTRFPYETKASTPERENLLLEPVMFVVQTIALPVELIANPPGKPQVWHGAEYRPTYTAQPPLPPPGGVVKSHGMPYGLGGGPPAPGQTTGGPVGGPPGPPGTVAPPLQPPGAPGAAGGAGAGR